MRGWLFLLGGLLVWTVHFFAIYGIASIFLTSMMARILVGIVSLLCLAGLAWLLKRSWALYASEQDQLSRWMALIATFVNAISLVAVFWQTFPAIIA
jgi:hypothetical protein